MAPSGGGAWKPLNNAAHHSDTNPGLDYTALSNQLLGVQIMAARETVKVQEAKGVTKGQAGGKG